MNTSTCQICKAHNRVGNMSCSMHKNMIQAVCSTCGYTLLRPDLRAKIKRIDFAERRNKLKEGGY